jgi:hypothetical protein
MSCDKYYRMIIKRASGLPTVPASADHRDGSWTVNDIYEGELYQDTDTGIIYTRMDSEIVTAGRIKQIGIKHLLASQASTSAPTDIQFEDTLGGGAWSYVGVGVYRYTETGMFPDGKTSVIINTGGKNGFARAWRESDNNIRVETFDTSLNPSNDILDQTSLLIEVMP